MRRYLWLLALVVIFAIGAMACEEEEEAAPTLTPAATPTPAAGYPLTVTDMLERSVTIDAPPEEIVATSPTAIEMLYAVGGTAVARDASADYPPEIQDLPTVGRAYAPDFEGIVALDPDLVIADSVNQARFVQQFEGLDVPVLMVGAENFDDVLTGMRLVGQVLGLADNAERAIASLESERDALLANVPEEAVSVLIVIMDPDRNIYAAKPESYPGSLAEMLGAENPTAGLPETGPYPGYTLYSPEQAVEVSPDVVLALSPAPPPAPRLSEVLPNIPGYSDLDAVKGGRLHELDVDLFLQAPGPRVLEALKELAAWLYPGISLEGG